MPDRWSRPWVISPENGAPEPITRVAQAPLRGRADAAHRAEDVDEVVR